MPAMRCSPASATIPPMTMREGLSRLTHAARTEPMSRPAWRTAWLAVTSPERTSETTSELVSASRPAAESAVATAWPLATASRQPTLPQRQGASAPLAVGDDARADAGGDLDEEHVGDVGPGAAVLAQGHDVHVVVDEDRRVEVLREDAGDVDVVPARHDRGVDRAAGGVLDGTREPDAHAHEVVGAAAGGRDELRAGLGDPRQDDVGPVGDGERRVGLRQDVRREVGDGETCVRRTQ